jgi:periplasmic protein TonB
MKRAFVVAVVTYAFVHAIALGQSTQGRTDTAPRPPASGRPLRVRVSEGVSRGLLIKKVEPQYPDDARQARIQGTVVLKAMISKTGDLKELNLVSGHPMLAPAAIDAVRQWKFKPYLLNGDAVEVETQIQVNFRLSGG